ncbi:MAG: STAS domain-containing protein [Bacteroidota bacterium]
MIRKKLAGEELIVSLYGVKKLNCLFAEQVGAELKKLLKENSQDLLFDLSDIRFIDSAGFSMLKEVNEAAGNFSVRFMLCNISEEVNELLDLVELKDYFVSCKREIVEKVLAD